MNDREPCVVPLLVLGACGLAGAAVDVFDALALLGAPELLHGFDLIAALAYTVILCGVGAHHYIRHYRTRQTT